MVIDCCFLSFFFKGIHPGQTQKEQRLRFVLLFLNAAYESDVAAIDPALGFVILFCAMSCQMYRAEFSN